jgi:predicted nucleic acid-binding protein
LVVGELAAGVIVLDSSVALAAMDYTDPNHERVLEVLTNEQGSLILPVAILSELTYMIERNFGERILDEFLVNVSNRDFVLDCGERDIDRILELIRRYKDFPLGFADAAVVACGERNGGLIATLDFRHFGPIAREGSIQLAV